MQISRFRLVGLRRALLSGAALAGIAASASAGEVSAPAAGAAAAPVVEDVVVTATRQSTRLQKTPVAVTVVSGSAISAQGLVTARDLAGQAPGFTIVRAGITPLTQIFFIRGIGDADPIFDPNVAVYVDDVYLPRAINGMTDLTDVERVELLRGPQGTLFGENADAGAIRYITRTPKDRPEAEFDVGYGTYDAVQAHLYAAGPIVKGLLDGSIAYAHDQHNGYTWDPTISERVNNQLTDGARLKLLATPGSRLTVTVSADGTFDRSATAYYSPLRPIIGGTLQSPVYGAFDPSKSYASQRPENNSWSAGASVRASYDLTDALKLTSISAVRGFAQNPVNYNNDGQPLVPYNNANRQLVTISDNAIVYKEGELTQEVQLQGNYRKLDFTGGAYFLFENFSSNRIGYVVSPVGAGAAPAYPEDQIGDTRTWNYAGYLQGDYRLTPDLTLTLGGRYTLETRHFNFEGAYDTYAGVPITPNPAAPASTAAGFAARNNFTYAGQKTWTSFTPKYGVSYQVAPSVFTYFSVSEGFDAGGFNNRASNLASALPYNQENVTSYELGLKTDSFAHRLRFNADVFYNDYKGLQETASVVSPVTLGYVSVRSNAKSAHTQGFEAEAAATPLDGLTINASASYLETRFDNFANAAVSGGKLISATGNQLPFSPRWQLFGGFSYRLPLPALPGELTVGADATYETSYFSDVFNYRQGQVPGQAFADAFLGYAPPGGRLKFTLTARNLADRRTLQSITWGGTPNLWQGPVSPPRTVLFKVAYALR